MASRGRPFSDATSSISADLERALLTGPAGRTCAFAGTFFAAVFVLWALAKDTSYDSNHTGRSYRLTLAFANSRRDNWVWHAARVRSDHPNGFRARNTPTAIRI